MNHALSFKPKYHVNIDEAAPLGKWTMAPSYGAASGGFMESVFQEMKSITAEGGSVIYFDPKGDSAMPYEKKIRELVEKYPIDPFILNFKTTEK